MMTGSRNNVPDWPGIHLFIILIALKYIKYCTAPDTSVSDLKFNTSFRTAKHSRNNEAIDKVRTSRPCTGKKKRFSYSSKLKKNKTVSWYFGSHSGGERTLIQPCVPPVPQISQYSIVDWLRFKPCSVVNVTGCTVGLTFTSKSLDGWSSTHKRQHSL